MARTPRDDWAAKILTHCSQSWALYESIEILAGLEGDYSLSVVVLCRCLFEKVLIVDQMVTSTSPTKEQAYDDWTKRELYNLTKRFSPDSPKLQIWKPQYDAANVRWKDNERRLKIEDRFQTSRLATLLRCHAEPGQERNADLYSTFYRLACTHTHGDAASPILLSDASSEDEMRDGQMMAATLLISMMYVLQEGFSLQMDEIFEQFAPLIDDHTEVARAQFLQSNADERR